MAVSDRIGRRLCIPVLHCKGTYYEVGYNMGRTFNGMIERSVNNNKVLNECYIPLYHTPDGRKAYDETLESLKKNYPQYIKELEGLSDGSQVPFYKLMLYHMDDIIPLSIEKESRETITGCTTVILNQPGQEIIGHNEDSYFEFVDHFYMLSAHIKDDGPKGRIKVNEEKFTSLCYAGHLPGFTMSYNHHGFVSTVNVISPRVLRSGKTPRTFITRSLLAAENFSQAEEIMKDYGTGIGDGLCINIAFINETPRVFYNVELGPPKDNGNESVMDIVKIKKGEHLYHTNRYLRLKIQEFHERVWNSSNDRQRVIDTFPTPKNANDVVKVLGDTQDKKHPVFNDRRYDDPKENVCRLNTLATGVFNLSDLTWSIYSENPKTSEPLLVLPIQLKEKPV